MEEAQTATEGNKEDASESEYQEGGDWSALEGVSRANTLLDLPRSKMCTEDNLVRTKTGFRALFRDPWLYIFLSPSV
ncbi:hypothetical protein SAY86_001805 [Trapa natans]|uniref:Uncharacterized protein n=1 Tax=Trapa natans TaxID=22666 RepID=A0AAN7R2Q5_TRANT|nr:hypothetical protein SAY86_001805 [Trapa natans]